MLRKLLFMLGLVAVMCQAHAQLTTYDYTFETRMFTANEGGNVANLGGVTWTFTGKHAGSSMAMGYYEPMGQQIGSVETKYFTECDFTTSDFESPVTKVEVQSNAWGTAPEVSLQVLVGGTEYGKAQSLTTESTVYTFDAPASGAAQGDVVIRYRQPYTDAAIYIKAIHVTYYGGEEMVQAPKISLETGTYVGEQKVEITAEEGADIYYTLDGSEPTTASTKYSGTISITENCTLKAIAVKDGKSSYSVTATYIITTEEEKPTGKQVYIPQDILRDYSETDDTYKWCRKRSAESDNFVVFWEKGFGDDPGKKTWSKGVQTVNIQDLLAKLEKFYQLYAEKLKFIDTTREDVPSAKYKMVIELNFTTDWMAYGGGSDNRIGTMWISPSTCQPVGSTIAHECGHCFQAQAGFDTGGAAGFRANIGKGGCTFWEQTAEWQAFQSYPKERFDAHMSLWLERHNMAFTHEYMRYQSTWLMHYWTQKRGIDMVGRVWRGGTSYSQDPNQVYMALNNLSIAQYQEELYDAAARGATFDIDITRQYGTPYIGKYKYGCVDLGDGTYQVAYKNCPQGAGFNVIPLQVPAAGTEITMSVTSLAPGSDLAPGDPGVANDYNDVGDMRKNVSHYTMPTSAEGAETQFLTGYVAYLKNGERVYGDMTRVDATHHDVSFTVPENTLQLFFIVSPAPVQNGEAAYYVHKWDGDDSVDDDQWPYQFSLTGTELGLSAAVYELAEPQIDGRLIANATLTYDVYMTPMDSYASTDVTVSGRGAATLATAFQMESTEINGLMQTYSASGPGSNKVMFYAAQADGTLLKSGSTANGYGHWFGRDGSVVAWGGDSYVFSEFSPASLTFNIGQYPNRCKVGDEFTIAQALRYKNKSGEVANVVFIFRIHVTEGQIGNRLAEVNYDEATALDIAETLSSETAAAKGGTYDLSGRQINPATARKGIYVSGGRKVLVR